MLFLLALSLCAGWLARRFGPFPASTPESFNRFIIYVSLPAVVLVHLPTLEIKTFLLGPLLMPWIFFFLSVLFFSLLGRLYKWPARTKACLILVCGLGNTSFVGFPMIEAFYGKAGLPVGIVIDQGGSFLVVSLLGTLVAVYYSDRGSQVGWGGLLKKMVSFPPFLAVLAGLIFRYIPQPSWLTFTCARLADTLGPMALFSVGFQLQLSRFQGRAAVLAQGLLFKMLLAPALLVPLYWFVFGLRDLNFQVTLFEAAMPPMITAGIMASEEGLDPDLASLLVGVGIILSFVTLPFWWVLLGKIPF